MQGHFVSIYRSNKSETTVAFNAVNQYKSVHFERGYKKVNDPKKLPRHYIQQKVFT